MKIEQHTVTLGVVLSIDTGACDQDIVDNRENTFTTYPRTILAHDPSIVQYCGLIQKHPFLMHIFRERHFFWMEVFEAGLPEHLMWLVT